MLLHECIAYEQSFRSWKQWGIYKIFVSLPTHAGFMDLPSPVLSLTDVMNWRPPHFSALMWCCKVWLCRMCEGCRSHWRTQPPWALPMIYNALLRALKALFEKLGTGGRTEHLTLMQSDVSSESVMAKKPHSTLGGDSCCLTVKLIPIAVKLVFNSP